MRDDRDPPIASATVSGESKAYQADSRKTDMSHCNELLQLHTRQYILCYMFTCVCVCMCGGYDNIFYLSSLVIHIFAGRLIFLYLYFLMSCFFEIT